MLDSITQILETILKAFEWYLASDLPIKTIDALEKVTTYTASVLVPLLWLYIEEIQNALK